MHPSSEFGVCATYVSLNKLRCAGACKRVYTTALVGESLSLAYMHVSVPHSNQRGSTVTMLSHACATDKQQQVKARHYCMPACMLACTGVAGIFSTRQLAMLDACVPGGINYQEPDSTVRLPPLLQALCCAGNRVCPSVSCHTVQVTLPPTRFSAAGPTLGQNEAGFQPAKSPVLLAAGGRFIGNHLGLCDAWQWKRSTTNPCACNACSSRRAEGPGAGAKHGHRDEHARPRSESAASSRCWQPRHGCKPGPEQRRAGPAGDPRSGAVAACSHMAAGCTDHCWRQRQQPRLCCPLCCSSPGP